MTYRDALADFVATQARQQFARSADAFAFAFEENQIALELAREHERDNRRARIATHGHEESSCSSE